MTLISHHCHNVKLICDVCGCQVLVSLPAEGTATEDDTRQVAREVTAMLERGGWARQANGAHHCPFCRPEPL